MTMNKFMSVGVCLPVELVCCVKSTSLLWFAIPLSKNAVRSKITTTNQSHHKWHHLNSYWSPLDQVLFADYIYRLTNYGTMRSLGCVHPMKHLVLCGQTLFCTEGKCLGYGHTAVCHPTPWSVYHHSTALSCMIPEHEVHVYVINGKIQNFSLSRKWTWGVRSELSCNIVGIEIVSAERSEVLLWQ